jgi:hypothetical protein
MLNDFLSRRTFIESALRMASLPAGITFFTAWSKAAEHQHGGNSAPPEPSLFDNYKPQFFSGEDFQALQAFTEILIPTDETPGAREAHCAHFIDFLLHSMDNYSPETQDHWRSAMAALKSAGFHAAGPETRVALVTEIAKPEIDPAAHHPAFSAYQLIKKENTFAFYTARAGLIESLDYRGNSFNIQFPACTHPEHHQL